MPNMTSLSLNSSKVIAKVEVDKRMDKNNKSIHDPAKYKLKLTE